MIVDWAAALLLQESAEYMVDWATALLSNQFSGVVTSPNATTITAGDYSRVSSRVLGSRAQAQGLRV